jgi:hypothetical protein
VAGVTKGAGFPPNGSAFPPKRLCVSPKRLCVSTQRCHRVDSLPPKGAIGWKRNRDRDGVAGFGRPIISSLQYMAAGLPLPVPPVVVPLSVAIAAKVGAVGSARLG